MTTDFAIVVAGGGVVGAASAALLQRRARVAPGSVLLVDRALPAAPTAAEPLDTRVSAISRAGLAVLAQAGADAHLATERFAPYERLRVWSAGVDPLGPAALCFDAAEIAMADLGVVAENRALQSALLAAARDAGAEVRTGVIGGVNVTPDAATLTVDGAPVTAELLVIADGATSPLREALGIAVDARAYGQSAIVASLAPERAHASTAWQCFLAGGPVALLPLANGDVSLVWSLPEPHALERMALDDDAFTRELEAAMPVLGALRLTSRRALFPLRRQTAERWSDLRSVLVGDAAHTLHPLAGQGLNQGLLDVAALATALANRPPRESVGAARALSAYERSRRAAYAPVAAIVDTLDRLFTTSTPGRLIGAAALGVAARSRALRAWFMREASLSTGPASDLRR